MELDEQRRLKQQAEGGMDTALIRTTVEATMAIVDRKQNEMKANNNT
jgi:hypothetical protein